MSTTVKFTTTIEIDVDVEAEIHGADSSTGQPRQAEITSVVLVTGRKDQGELNPHADTIETLAEEAMEQ